MENWRGIQQQYIDEMESVFVSIPITKIPWYSDEVKGIYAVDRLGRDLPDNRELFDTEYLSKDGSPALFGAETYEPVEGGYCMKLRVPGAVSVSGFEKKAGPALSLQLHDLDLDVRADNVLRRIPLPNTLRGAKITDAKVEEGILRVVFCTDPK